MFSSVILILFRAAILSVQTEKEIVTRWFNISATAAKSVAWNLCRKLWKEGIRLSDVVINDLIMVLKWENVTGSVLFEFVGKVFLQIGTAFLIKIGVNFTIKFESFSK